MFAFVSENFKNPMSHFVSKENGFFMQNNRNISPVHTAVKIPLRRSVCAEKNNVFTFSQQIRMKIRSSSRQSIEYAHLHLQTMRKPKKNNNVTRAACREKSKKYFSRSSLRRILWSPQNETNTTVLALMRATISTRQREQWTSVR